MKHLTDSELINYVSGVLSDDWNKQIEQHLTECETCQGTIRFLEGMHSEWQEPTTIPNLNFTETVMGKIQSDTLPAAQPQETTQAAQVIQFKANKSNSKLKYLHFGLAAAAMLLFTQLNLSGKLFDKSVDAVQSSAKKMKHATVTVSNRVKTVNEFTEKQMKNINKLEELRNEKTN